MNGTLFYGPVSKYARHLTRPHWQQEDGLRVHNPSELLDTLTSIIRPLALRPIPRIEEFQ
jgi:hypothetical protein